jgi:hypothetical protein
MTTLQDSLYGTDCGFELLSQEVTPLRHPGSPQTEVGKVDVRKNLFVLDSAQEI